MSNPQCHADGGPSLPDQPVKARGRLLVVDDEPAVGRVMAHAAAECGFKAEVVISAAAFRAYYETDPPEVILLDLSLPGSDGIELLRFLAERDSKALILIVSGFDRRVLEAAMRLGLALGLRMGESLTKPLLVGDLADALDRALAPNESVGDELCFRS